MSTLSEKVAELHRDGIKSVDGILRALVEPSVTVDPITRKRPRSPAQKAFIAASVEGKWATRAELRAAENPAGLVRQRMADKWTAGATNADKTAVARDAFPALLALLALADDNQRAAGSDEDEDELTELRTLGPSWWENNFPNDPPPTPHAIRMLLKELNL